MTDRLMKPYTGPSAWTREQMETDLSWQVQLDTDQIAQVRRAVEHAKSTGKPLDEITQEDFPLGTLSQRVRQLAEELENGRGFELWRGLPVEEWTLEERSLAYWGLGRHLGSPVVQNYKGELFGHVQDTTSTDPSTNANSRFYHTNRAAPFHVDGGDIVGLMCVRTSKEGGASLLVSSTSIYNAILRDAPELIPLLYQPLWFDHRGERNAVTGLPYWVTAICGWTGSKLSMMYLRNFIESAQRYEGAPALTDQHRRLLDLIDHYAESKALCLSMDFKPGDIQWLNNHVTLHSRTGFTDWPEPEKKRWLMRLWLNQFKRDRFTQDYGFYGIAVMPKDERGLVENVA